MKKSILTRLRLGNWHICGGQHSFQSYTEFMKGRFVLRINHPSGEWSIRTI